MKIKAVESTIVKPISATPCGTIWLSNLDLIYPLNVHVPTQSFYRSSGDDPNFLDAGLLKEALSRALVEFYPLAGRLKRSDDENNRIEVDCNGEGVLFVEAEVDAHLDDLGQHFTPTAGVALIPEVDYSKGISTYPICLVQMTRFKCGGVCLSVANNHLVLDGHSVFHFITTWSHIARGAPITMPPFFDRTVLRARDPPQPKFPHAEYRHIPPPHELHDLPPQSTKFSVLELTRDQLNILKSKCNEDDGAGTRYSTFEVFAAHIWRCVSTARGLPENQESRLNIPVNGRFKLRPPLPPGYFGNAILTADTVAFCGELRSKPLKYAVEKIHASLVRTDDEYMRSALDYLEVHDDLKANERGGRPTKSPNLGIISWARLPIYDADFGWGSPHYVGLGILPLDEFVVIMPSPFNDGGLLCGISLVEEHMNFFENLLYDM